MAQQGQVFKLKTRGSGGKANVGVPLSGRRASLGTAAGGRVCESGRGTQALQAALERLNRRKGRLAQITMSELVAEYLAQHEAEPRTIAKLRWLLAKAVCAFGDRRVVEPQRARGVAARRRPGRPDVAERFEGFVGGVELVNGYEELTDPAEQETRLLALTDRHRRSTGETLPVDPGFLDALRCGLPPCAGAALGVDRLVMLLLGGNDIADGMYR